MKGKRQKFGGAEMKKKKLLGTVIVFLAAMFCTACVSNGEKKNVSEKEEEPEEVVLTFLTSQTWVNRDCTVDSDLNEKFEKETGIRIDMQVIPDDQYMDVLKVRMSTGETPDIFMIQSGEGAKRFLPEKYFADLSQEEWVSRYIDYAKEGTSIDGKTIGLMRWNLDGWGMLYNKKMYEKYQLDIPHTKEEFFEVCRVLKENGIVPIYECGKETWHWAVWFSQYGAYVANKHADLYEKLNENEMKFADVPEFETYLNELKEVYDQGFFGENCLANSWDSSYENLENKLCANFLGYQSYPQELKERHKGRILEEWEMYPIPLAGNNISARSTGGIMAIAYKDSKNLEEVKQFFDFLAREDNLKEFYNARKELQGNPSFVDVEAVPTRTSISMEENSVGDGIEMEYGVKFWDNTQIGLHIQEMLMGGKTAREVLEAIDADRQKMFDTLR